MRQAVPVEDLLARSYATIMRHGQGWSHPAYGWGQVLTSAEGNFELESGEVSWRISPGQALLIPEGHDHRILLPEKCDIRALFVQGSTIGDFRLVTLSPLLRELLYHTSLLGALSQRDPIHQSLMRLTIHGLTSAPAIPLDAKWPKSRELKEFARLLVQAPGDSQIIQSVSSRLGLGRRTVERRFRDEVGIGVAEWRREYWLIHAAHLVLQGLPIGEIAFASGYSTSSAFIFAFRRKFGATPSSFKSMYGSRDLPRKINR